MPGSRSIARCCVLGVCATLTGCAAPVARRPAAMGAGDQGGAWEVVLPGGPSGRQLAMGPESTRRDEAMNYRAPEVTIDADRPSLDESRRLFFSRQADELIYFRPAGPYRWRGDYDWR